MNLAFVWGAGAVLSAWIILGLLGGERERKMREFEASRPPAPPPAPEQSPKAAEGAPIQRKAA